MFIFAGFFEKPMLFNINVEIKLKQIINFQYDKKSKT